jgi:WD40 repeat protein
VVAVGFADESIRIFDTRIKEGGISVLQTQSTEMIKCIKLSSDATACFTAGSDCMLKLWHLSSGKCIETVGDCINKKVSSFHRDSITALDFSGDQDIIYSGGRDGCIFRTDAINSTFEKIYQSPDKKMITCIALDQDNSKLWYGTPDSSVKCLHIGS